MKFSSLCIFMSIVAYGCSGSISRDRAAYTAEVALIDRMVREGAPANRDAVVNGCTCASGVWRSSTPWATDAQCSQRAEWWTVYAARWAWHHSMMRFNAGLMETRPGAAPVIPAVSCELLTVTQ
jgi:hypothetical protein